MTYKIGDKVYIVSKPIDRNCDCYKEIIHCMGEIVYVPHGKHRKRYAIKVEGHRNPKVSRISGCYWLEPGHFLKVDERLWRKRHEFWS